MDFLVELPSPEGDETDRQSLHSPGPIPPDETKGGDDLSQLIALPFDRDAVPPVAGRRRQDGAQAGTDGESSIEARQFRGRRKRVAQRNHSRRND